MSVYRIKEHIYENRNLTFGEIKKIYEDVATANLAMAVDGSPVSEVEMHPVSSLRKNYLEEAESFSKLSELSEKKVLLGAMNRLDELMKAHNLKDNNTIFEYMISRLNKEMQGEVPDFAKRAIIKKILGVRGISTLDILRKIEGPDRKKFKGYLSKAGQIDLLNKSVAPLESQMVMFVFENLRGLQSVLSFDNSPESRRHAKQISNVIKEAHASTMSESIRSLKRGLAELSRLDKHLTKEVKFVYNEKNYSVSPSSKSPIKQMLRLFKGGSAKQQAEVVEEKEESSNNENHVGILVGKFDPFTSADFSHLQELSNQTSVVYVFMSNKDVTIGDSGRLSKDDLAGIIKKYTDDAGVQIKLVVSPEPVLSMFRLIGDSQKNNKNEHFIIKMSSKDEQGKPPSLDKYSDMVQFSTYSEDTSEQMRAALASKNAAKVAKFVPDVVNNQKEYAKLLIDKSFNMLTQEQKNTKIGNSTSGDLLEEGRVVKRGKLYCFLDNKGNNRGCYNSVYGAMKRKQTFRKQMHAEEQELEEMMGVAGGAVSGVAGSLGTPIVGVKLNKRKKSGE
jgi:hypothetical protein